MRQRSARESAQRAVCAPPQGAGSDWLSGDRHAPQQEGAGAADAGAGAGHGVFDTSVVWENPAHDAGTMASPFFTGDKAGPGEAGDWEPAAGPGKPAAGAAGQDQAPLDWNPTGSIPETPSSTSSSGWRSEPGRARPGARGMRPAQRSGSTAASEAAPLVEFASYRGMVVMEFCEAGARRRRAAEPVARPLTARLRWRL
jgi:hypothetical protein